MVFSSCVGWLFWLSDIERLQNQNGVAGHIRVGVLGRGIDFGMRAVARAKIRAPDAQRATRRKS